MVYERKPTVSFRPRQVLKKKPPGRLMQNIRKQVQQSHAYMPKNAPYRNTGPNRGEDVGNIGCAYNGKTYDSSKSVHVNQGRDNVLGVKPQKYSSGDNFAMATGNIVPLGKRKLLVVSSSPMELQKSMSSSSSNENRLKKMVKSNKGEVSLVEASLVPKKVNIVASTQGNIVGCRVHIADERNKDQSFKVKEHKNPGSKRKCILGIGDLRGNSNEVKVGASIQENVVDRRVHRRIETSSAVKATYSRSNPNLQMKDPRGNSDVHRRIETSFVGSNMKQTGGLSVKDGRIDNDKFKSKPKTILEKMPREHASIEDNETNGGVKRTRKYIPPDDDDDDDMSGDGPNLIGGDGQNIVGVNDDIDGLTTQTSAVEQYGYLPIDEPIWSGMLKTESEGYVSLEARLLAKSCEKVWECSRSLRQMIQVTKLYRSEGQPKCFMASSPTEDNIGLYLFPQGMRPNEDYDKLVNDVMDNDLILRAIVDEAEMLIFPSILLPERHQTFQGKHYLWGLFKRREDKVHVEGEKHLRGTRCEKENGKQGCSRTRVGQKGIDKDRRTASLCRSNASTGPAERAAAVTPTSALATTSHAPSSPRPDERAAAEAATPATAVTSHAPSSTHPAAAEAATPATAAAAAASHSPTAVVPHAGMYFIAQPTSDAQLARMQQHLEALVREGALVFAMRGETIGFGVGGASSAAAV